MSPITYYATNQLTKQELVAISDLIANCHLADQTCRDPYLTNQFNYFPNLLSFHFLVFKQKIIGLATIYADQKPPAAAEITLFVAPKFHFQGLAKQLITAVKKELASYNYHQLFF